MPTKNSMLDENDIRSIYSTPKKSKPPAKEIVTPTARKNVHQRQIDRAYAEQAETNQLLKKIVEQNDLISKTLNELLELKKAKMSMFTIE